MKPLLTIIALALSMTVAGQTKDTITLKHGITNDLEKGHPPKWVTQEFYYSYIALSLNLMQAYIQECYADSVLVPEMYTSKTRKIMEIWHSTGDTTYSTMRYWVPCYEPVTPTFEGYVKWMEKLLK